MAIRTAGSRLHFWASRHQHVVTILLLLFIIPRVSVTEIVTNTSEPTSTNTSKPISETSQNNASSHASGFPSSQNISKTIIEYYDCPNFCSCHYDSPQQHLKISCRKTSVATQPHDQRRIPLSNGVQRLGLNYLTFDYLSIPSLTLLGNNSKLHELNLHHVSIDLQAFVNWNILRTSSNTLRKLRMNNVEPHARARIPDIYGDVMSMSHFSRLHLDNLSICNSSSDQLTQLFMSALPPVTHLSLLNSSLSTLDTIDVSRLASTLQSLDLSSNRIATLPSGLFRQLPKLSSLDLSKNRLEHLQEQVFVGLTALKKLNLSHNKIKYADADVFTPLISLHSLDISQNELLQIFEPYFEDNVELRILYMRQTWAHDSFLDSTTATRSLTEMDKLLDTLERVETLDLRDNQMLVIPESLSHLRHLKKVYLTGNRWSCSCFDRWVIHWLGSSSLSNETDSSGQVLCNGQEPIINYIKNLNCSNREITARTPRKYYGIQGTSKTLKCHPQRKGNNPKIYWSLPRGGPTLQSTHSTSVLESPDSELPDSSYHRVLSNGDLHISNLTTEAFGLYTCVAEYSDLTITHFIHLGVDTSIFLDVKLASIVIGWLTSLAFLMTVLSIQLIRFVLNKHGIDCPNVTAPYKTRRIRRFFENMEQHKNSQLEWLRDNYNQQVKRVKDNCTYQVERIRESYTIQTKNLSDIRDYGAQQLQTVREQYHDQIRRVSTYSTQQLCRVRENYVFQRNRVGKFSSHQMLRLRETYKWQAQTVNKILENLPKTLNFDSCRGVGACGRTDSIYMDELLEIGEEIEGDAQAAEELLPFVDPDHDPNCNPSTDPNYNPSTDSDPNVKPDHVTLVIPSTDTISTEDKQAHGNSIQVSITDPAEQESVVNNIVHPIV